MNDSFEGLVAETTKRLEDSGLLLVAANKHGKSNVMTIGWGLIGIFWQRRAFMVAVRPSRYTHDLIEDNAEFTVNVPTQDMDAIVQHCGEVSGREHDKFSECKLDTTKAREVKVPVIKQCKIHYECRVFHKLESAPMKERSQNNNQHTLYFGEILAVY